MLNIISLHVIVQLIVSYLLSVGGKHLRPQPDALLHSFRLRNDSNAIREASNDYGNIVHEKPSSVLYPSSIIDIIKLVKQSYNQRVPFTIAARGNGHSVRGQAMAPGGVVIDMNTLGKKGNRVRVSKNWLSGRGYADVGGEQLWIEVLREVFKHGLSPPSWTDSLFLTVGGTLSNAGIGGQAFLHGPQISNVLELDVITGKGELITCSRNKNPELFLGVLGGLGQFGIITRARIVLIKAPARAKWVRLLYTNFALFSRDQEHLIASKSPNYVEGFIITNRNKASSLKSYISSNSSLSHISSLTSKHSILYSIDLAKYYDNRTSSTVEKEFTSLLKELKQPPEFIFKKDVPITDFLNRVGNLDRKASQAHPWLNLLIPKSRIMDFNANVLLKMMPKLRRTSGNFLFYPFNRNKWDNRMSVVIPNEDIFYTLRLLHTSRANDTDVFDKFNNEILAFCKKSGIMVKQYLPHYKSREEWKQHFGSKWDIFLKRKTHFDPKMILSPGQRIFN